MKTLLIILALCSPSFAGETKVSKDELNTTINRSSAAYFTGAYAYSSFATKCIGSTITFTTDNVPVTIEFTGGVFSLLYSGGQGTGVIGVLIDGKFVNSEIDTGGSKFQVGAQNNNASAQSYYPANFSYTTTGKLSAGSHTFCLWTTGTNATDTGVYCNDISGSSGGVYARGTDGCKFMVKEAR